MSANLKLKFQKLDYQEKAVNNIISVFEKAEFQDVNNGLSNPLLDKENYHQEIKTSIDNIRTTDKITQGEINVSTNDPLYLDILMETGTGKTMTFIETIYELNKQYGIAKFIILVPSSAIRQGAIKNINITKEFFQKQYGKTISAFNYTKKKSASKYTGQNIANYINNSNKNISVLITTFQAFNSDEKIINRKNMEANLLGKARSYMEAIAELNPFIIIDEPHRFGGEKTLKFLPNFKSQVILRFGATFANDYKNLIYVLDSVDAFKNNLVKSITVQQIGSSTLGKDTLEFVDYHGRIMATRQAKIRHKSISGKSDIITGGIGCNLGEKLGVDILDDYIIEKITTKEILFSNDYNLLLRQQESYGMLADEMQRLMIETTIETHFEKEEKLFKQGIKALSLIFINNVKKYIQPDGKTGELAILFEDIYKAYLNKKLKEPNLDQKYRDYLERTKDSIDKVHNGYFAISKGIKGEEEAIDLILNEKEKLLSDETDMRFIFSMWALQEGWDNPNVFTLCKLAPSNSTITKLQQIGRGLRLAVKKTESGFERITFDSVSESEFTDINKLDVIVPDSEENFVESIQNEILKHNIHNKTKFVSDEIFRESGICNSRKAACRLLNILEEKGLVKFDNEDEDLAEILNIIRLDEAIAEAQDKGIIFDADKLEKHFNTYVDINAKIKKKEDKRKSLIINKENWGKFKTLWSDITRESVCVYDIDENKLRQEIINRINKNLNIDKRNIKIKAFHQVENIDAINTDTKSKKTRKYNSYTLKEFIKEIADKTKLSFQTIAYVLKEIDNDKFKMIANDEANAIRQITTICMQAIYAHIITTLSYEINEVRVRETALTDDDGNVLQTLDPGACAKYQHEILNSTIKEKSLTENIIEYDSEAELKTINESDNVAITVFAKIPYIRIPVPGGRHYNPDFAYVITGKEGESLHFVLENKGYDDLDESARGLEKRKIEVAEKFFEALREKVNVPITYKTKLNYQTLAEIIESIIYNPPASS